MMKLCLLLFLLVMSRDQSLYYSVIIPVFFHEYTPPREKYGVAWQHTNQPYLANQLGSFNWYNSSSYEFTDGGRALPIIRPTNPHQPYRIVLDTLGSDYDGYILTFNEPVNQDIINPNDAVDWMNVVRRELPYVTTVGPNILPDHFSWLEDYLAAGGDPFDVWSLHIYDNAPCSPNECVNELCHIADVVDCIVWVTEFNYPNNRSDYLTHFTEQLQELESDNRVDKIFAYTAVHGCCGGVVDLLTKDYECTPACQVWITR